MTVSQTSSTQSSPSLCPALRVRRPPAVDTIVTQDYRPLVTGTGAGHDIGSTPTSLTSPAFAGLGSPLVAGRSASGGSPVCSGSQPARQAVQEVARAVRRHVTIVNSPTSAHPVTPYGQLYGKHPSSFNFDRKGRMQPSAEELEAIRGMARQSVAVAEGNKLHIPSRSQSQTLIRDALRSGSSETETEEAMEDSGPMPLSPILLKSAE
eukprot:CAMPEP_0115120670 /NCGR_PEP_ID=MMETSP0227-20121206/45823_1 /TAXON_ID=89957 /ORGANISM="Polarella glacialis, Strain CCMP 1383" /LENGTH=207 /DNA_ID=CAMNT_0002522371 /DNA_START=76 /DNA_END=699 /DNA_ORIENTATION=-